MYQIKGFVNLFQWQVMGNKWIEVNFICYGVFYYVWQLIVFFYVVEGGIVLYVVGYQLEWMGFDFLFGVGYIDDYVFILVFMVVFQCCVYYIYIVDVFEVEIYFVVGQFNNYILNWFIVVVWIDKIGCVYFFSESEFIWVGINCQNVFGLCLYCVLDYCQINVVQIKDCDVIFSFDFCCVMYCVDIGGYVVVQQVYFI